MTELKRKKFIIKEGATCLHGKIIKVWDDPNHKCSQWILIKNFGKFFQKTLSFYRYRTDVNQGELGLSHFVPIEIIKKLIALEEIDIENVIENEEEPIDVPVKKNKTAQKRKKK